MKFMRSKYRCTVVVDILLLGFDALMMRARLLELVGTSLTADKMSSIV